MTTTAEYPTYSMSILWNMDARALNRSAVMEGWRTPAIPVDGDAPARSAARMGKNAEAWATLRRDVLDRLSHESDKVDAR